MKTWNNPSAVAQQFSANEYVSACFKLTCYTKNGSTYQDVYDDVNDNGVYDEGIDLALDVNDNGNNPSTPGRCPGYFTVDMMGSLVVNGFAKNKKTGNIDPIYYTFDQAHNKHVHAAPVFAFEDLEADPSNKS